jgi:transposase
MAQITVGVDIGKVAHQAAAFDRAADRLLGRLQFPVSRAGFERFATFLARLAATPSDLLVGLEATGHYHLTLAAFLVERGYPVVFVHPGRASQFRRAAGHHAKTDRIDAQLLARFIAVDAPAPLTPDALALVGLRELTRFRAEVVRDRTAAVNRLHAAIDQAFPEFLHVFRKVTTQTALTLLVAYPTTAALAAADPAVLTAVAEKTSRRQVRGAQIATLQEQARASVGLRDGAALGTEIRVLARRILGLNEEIAQAEETIAAEFAALGYTPEQFPAGGPVALATILAEAGDIRRFPSAKRFLAHFGWCPRDRQSGQYKQTHPRLAKAGNRNVRQVIWMLAVGIVRHPGPYHDYFVGRTAAGKNKMDSLIAVGRKLLTTIYAIVKTGRAYDPAYCHGSIHARSSLPAVA